MNRMMHPEHGYHVPSNSLEAEAMRAAGWVDDDGAALRAKRAAAATQAGSSSPVDPVPNLSAAPAPASAAAPMKRGPGRPRKAA